MISELNLCSLSERLIERTTERTRRIEVLAIFRQAACIVGEYALFLVSPVMSYEIRGQAKLIERKVHAVHCQQAGIPIYDDLTCD